MTKKVLVKAYTSGNLGDDLLVDILLRRYPNTLFYMAIESKYAQPFLYHPNIEIIKIPTAPYWIRVLRRLFPQNLLHAYTKRTIKSWEKFAKKMVEIIDAYVIIGGSIFMESSKNDTATKTMINNILVETFSSKLKYILGANFGPYLSREYYDFHVKYFTKFDDICFRDIASKNLFPLRNVRYAPDIVFQYKLPEIQKQKNSVGFSIIDLQNRHHLKQYEKMYVEKLAKTIKLYIESGYTPYIFSFCKKEGDEICAEKITRTIPDNIRSKVQTISYSGDINAFLETYCSMEQFYVTRFHSLILSILSHHKIFPFIYSKKVSTVLEDLKYDGEKCNIEDIKHFNEELSIENIEKNQIEVFNLPSEAELHFKKLDLLLNE